jgi:hypothetical protein
VVAAAASWTRSPGLDLALSSEEDRAKLKELEKVRETLLKS